MKRWMVIAAFVLLGLAICAAPASAAPPEHREVFAGNVRVENDGNGAFAASFDAPTTPNLRYALIVDNGCRADDPGDNTPCPAGVSALSISINEQVVFQRNGDLTHHTTRLSNLTTQDNRILITAGGAPASAARIRIIATPAGEPPAERRASLALQEATQMESRR